MLISIIIPIYNVAEYIPRCLDSIYSQDLDISLFEVIAINDGSTDNSSDIIRRYQKLYSNLQLIDKKNEGVSIARNIGIDNSTGQYLVFVDPDDAIFPDSLNSLVSLINKGNKASVIIMRAIDSNDIEQYSWIELFKDGDQIDSLQTINKGFIKGSVWGGAYKRSFICEKQIRFPAGIKNAEDTFFHFETLAYSNKVLFADVIFYKIIGRPGSASKVFSKSRIDSMIQSVYSVERFINDNKTVLPCVALMYFLKYSLISSLVNATIHTKGVGLSYLLRCSKKGLYKVPVEGIVFLKDKIKLLNISFVMYYLLSQVKERCRS